MAITTYRGRLIIFYSLVTFMLMTGLFSVLYFIGEWQIKTLTDRLLNEIADEKIADLTNNPQKYPANEVIEIMGKNYFKIIKTDTGTILKSLEGIPEDEIRNVDFLQKVRENGRIYKTITTAAGRTRTLFLSFDEKHIIQIALPLATQEYFLLYNRYLFISVSIVALLLSPVVGWILSGKSVKPIIKLTEDAHGIAHSTLRERLRFNQKGVEFANLTLAFNSVLERIDRFTENQKRFISEISHEIRSPLTAIKGNMEVTLRRRRGVEEYEEALSRSLNEIDRIILIANNLLFLTKADTGVIDLHVREFNLKKLLERVVMNKRHVISEKQLNIENRIEDIVFNGDEFLLTQLFSNLFDNAIHYSPARGVISLTSSQADSGVIVSIRDTGVGIPPGEKEKIFDRFYRVRQNLSMHETGSGLGLYLSRWIAEAHKGKISVDSTVGEGSIFNVYLPFKK